MTAVLVVGGAGYVGSHCCQELHASGYRPVVIDNFTTGHRDFVRWGPCEDGDVRDRDFLLDVFDRHKPAAVMHFAAKSLVGESVDHPEIYYDNNVSGTLNLLNCMVARGVSELVFSSTCAIYGAHGGATIDEDCAKGPLSPYGFTKLVCEQMMDDFSQAYGLRSVRLRYFNASGADPKAEIGEHHVPETHLIPLVLDVALGLREAIRVFGSDYPTPDGSAIRDYIHVCDLADAHVKAVDYLARGGPTMAVNLGTGTGSSVLDVIGQTEAALDRAIRIEAAPRRPGDATALVANPAQAQARLGWRPTRSALPQIIADAWRWHQKRFGG
ncbi:UDP-glucose 4-epimerase GalE [Chelatococcus reniformis]|uniref:UDP-glucose 4-epimerase n=1 Tax=Chelatococcus reniformis TaxID=1494448 RepID=A0A916UPF5_9HYPH|nr:UDP-glucose 4-epimerase GalE [Chelatococcus reniformis]GGC81879.1 UDP-glucose 4-epimerase [Chelatococcus reniformis]